MNKVTQIISFSPSIFLLLALCHGGWGDLCRLWF